MPLMSESSSPSAFSTLAELDRLVHEPARLAIMALLYVVESANFTFVMNQTGLTWGNLSTHISKLEAGSYVEVEKSFVGKRPNTNLRLTPEGRTAFSEYVTKMKQVLQEFPNQ
jgi:DNA-binding MarR family transcriptional regulator